MVKEKWLKKIQKSRFELSSIGGILTSEMKECCRILPGEQAGIRSREYSS